MINRSIEWKGNGFTFAKAAFPQVLQKIWSKIFEFIVRVEGGRKALSYNSYRYSSKYGKI